MNEIIYLLQILIGMLLWLNTCITYTLVCEISERSPCPIRHWFGKSIAYIVMFLIAFFIWPLGVFKLKR